MSEKVHKRNVVLKETTKNSSTSSCASMSANLKAAAAVDATTSDSAGSRVQSILGVFLIMFGCISNVVFLELIMTRDPGAGNLLTLFQFSFVALQGAVQNWSFPCGGFKKRNLPLWFYLLTTMIFFALSAINNMAFAFHISMPLHTIFRSCSLAASLFVGMAFFKHRYSWGQIVACVVVTIGVVVATLADAHVRASASSLSCDGCDAATGALPGAASTSGETVLDETVSVSMYEQWIAAVLPQVIIEAVAGDVKWLAGICMLFVALVLSASLGHIQGWGYDRWGKDWRENMFYSHALALPMFLSVGSDISSHVALWNNTEPDILSVFGYDIPISLYVLLLANVMTQFICVRGVFMLGSSAGTLTMTFTMTTRKFLSLLLSIWYFSNPFTQYHWFGSALVMGGVVLYTIAPKAQSTKKSKTE
jgi:solute carrier family 35 (UDP-xylose/UDP-N-acetylglucosamine transporter), member B4